MKRRKKNKTMFSRAYPKRKLRRCRCYFCSSNRQFRSLKQAIAAEEKLRDWGDRFVRLDR